MPVSPKYFIHYSFGTRTRPHFAFSPDSLALIQLELWTKDRGSCLSEKDFRYLSAVNSDGKVTSVASCDLMHEPSINLQGPPGFALCRATRLSTVIQGSSLRQLQSNYLRQFYQQTSARYKRRFMFFMNNMVVSSCLGARQRGPIGLDLYNWQKKKKKNTGWRSRKHLLQYIIL